MSDAVLRVMLVAGEPSGDLLGAALMSALRARATVIDFVGIGGPRMAAEGLESIVPFDDLSVMGLAEILPRAPRLLRHIRDTAAFARTHEPDVLVTIDSPGFSFRLARRLTGVGFKKVHFVAPSVWAWRPGRAGRMAPFYDHLLTLLPFEPPYFEAVGLEATFVGHPALEAPLSGDGAAFRTRHGISPGETVLLVLPGSRRSETARLLPIFGETVRRVARSGPAPRIIVPTVAGVETGVREAVGEWPGETVVTVDHAEKDSAFAAADLALAASGTVTLELARAGVPMVVGYRMNPLTALIARRLVKTQFVTLVNILLKRPVVPELLLGDCTPDRLAPVLDALLTDPDARSAQRKAFTKAISMLEAPGKSPSDTAAGVILDLVKT